LVVLVAWYNIRMIKALKSRTNWTIAIMFLIGGTEAIAQVIPDSIETVILGALGFAAMYFKMNPSQEY